MTALVTGATAGIGAEFCRQLAARGHDLVLVARNGDRLDAFADELRAAHRIRVEVLPADLSVREQLARVEARVGEAERPVDWVINNAGYGLRGDFDRNDIADEQAHLDVLVTAPMRIAHAALRGMLLRRRGVIINVASVAGYTPRGTYGAAKAWLLSFSRWASIAYRRRGITVTSVAPGFVNTEFHERMRASKEGIPRILWLDPPYVVAKALRAADRGRAVTVPSLRYKLIVALARVVPPRIAAAGALRPQ